jgi:hypothetical protein
MTSLRTQHRSTCAASTSPITAGSAPSETFLRRYELDDPALAWIGRIVHECDLEDELYDVPEAAGLDAIVRGISLIADDDALLSATTPVFDGLYELGKRHGMLGPVRDE